MWYLISLLVLCLVGCAKTPQITWQEAPLKPARPFPKLEIPITHGFSNMNPTEKNWEITDPKFAHWIEEHCYVVKANPYDPGAIKGEELYRIKCMADEHSDVILQR